MTKKEIMKVLVCFVLLVVTSTMPASVFALTDNITSASDTSARSASEMISALQADQEVKFKGTAIEYFSSTGTYSWNVRVEKIVTGPSELQGHTVTVALWSGDSGEFPSGHMDPEIEPGDKVGVYGLYVGEDYVTLSGSGDYYLTKTSLSNQPSVTVRYPNGGEAISIGAQVQVSAHATDDNAVTGVSFYYSCDSGSNWDILGEGARISGTAIGGVWNRTWNTKELNAGTNYMIKAVANDGAFTSEDRSDGTFSLLPSKVICVPVDYPTIQAAIDAASSGYKITVSSGTYFEHLIIDKPLKLIGKDKNTTIINGSRSGYCVHVTADNVEIGGFTIENGGCGVYLESSNESIMDNNIISDHGIGISLNDSNNNLIVHNGLSNNMLQLCAIHLALSNNNVICENDIFENGAGVFLYDSNHNQIYHNNFINNQKQAYDNTGTNSWDKGSSVGGNYWSDHTGTGNPSDDSQPYSIASNSIDHYPFQKQSGWVKDNQPAIPDSAGPISVTSSPSGATIELECFVGPTITTPYTVTDVPVGTHTLKLTLDGYWDWSTNVHVIAGTTSSVHATLAPMAVPPSTTPQPSTGKTHTGEDLSSIPAQSGMIPATEQKVEEIGGTPSGGVTGIKLWVLYNGAWTKDPAAIYYGEWTYMLIYLDHNQWISIYEVDPGGWKDWNPLGHQKVGYYYHQFDAKKVGWNRIYADGSSTGESNSVWIYVWPV